MHFRPLLGPNGMVPILIRDDDTNFFTKPNMLNSIYSDALRQGFKVSLSVVPFQKNIDDISVPPRFRTDDSHFSVANNEELTDYIKNRIKEGSFEILQHGYSHEIVKGGRGEFGDELDKRGEIQSGKNILRQAFEVDPKFFVPPGEDISKQNIGSILELGMIPIYRLSYLDSLLRSSLVPGYFKKLMMRGISSKYDIAPTDETRALQFIKPAVITVKKNMITWSPRLTKIVNLPSFDSMIRMTDDVLESCVVNRNPVCILNHYHLYFYDWNTSISRMDLYRTWKKVLEKFSKLKFGWKANFSDIYERANQLLKMSIVQTGSKITLVSDTHIQRLSFLTSHRLEPNSSAIFDEETNIITIDDLLPYKRLILYEKD